MYTIANIRPLGYNIGNQAINYALRQMLYEVFGRLVSVIDYPATKKHDNTTKAGLTAATIHELNRYADGVIVGGGNLFENNEIDVDPTALRALQPPLMLFSNSRGRIYDRKCELADRSDVIPDGKLKTLLERADISLSRDEATHQYLAAIDGKDQLGWCPTINIGRYASTLPPLPEREKVGALISVRTPSLMNVPYRFQSSVQSDIENTIRTLRDCGFKRIRILCNDSRDLDFATAFRYSDGVDSVYTSDVYQYLSLLKGAELIVSYRLHATLPAMACGVPTVNIVYDERAMSLFNDLGLRGKYLNLVELGGKFRQTLSDAVSSGGVNPLASEVTKLHWDKCYEFQVKKLKEFKILMEQHLSKSQSLHS